MQEPESDLRSSTATKSNRSDAPKLKQLADLCEANVCRRHLLPPFWRGISGIMRRLRCASERTTFDGTPLHRSFFRRCFVFERFGLGYTIDVLRGSKPRKFALNIERSKHGTGAILRDDWFRYAKDLIALGFLTSGRIHTRRCRPQRKVPPCFAVRRAYRLRHRSRRKQEEEAKVPVYEATLLDQAQIASHGICSERKCANSYIIFFRRDTSRARDIFAGGHFGTVTYLRFRRGKDATIWQGIFSVVAKYCKEHDLSSKISEKVSVRSRRKAR